MTSEIGNSLAGPGRRRAGLESHRPGRSWARDFENTTRWAGHGLGQATSARPARPHLLELVPPAKKNVGLEILDFLQFFIKSFYKKLKNVSCGYDGVNG